MNTVTTTVKGINDIITPEVRDAILRNGEGLEQAITAAFSPFEVPFVKGKSLSGMVKESPQYQALASDKKAQSAFFNKVKSSAKAVHLGEQLTLEAVVHGFWARFNGTLADKKTGDLKQLNVSFMAPTVKASKLDDEMARDVVIAANAALTLKIQAENAALRSEKATLEAEILSIKHVA